MNRSYSKIRHIQESNMIFEKRLLKEEGIEPSMGGIEPSMGGIEPSPTEKTDALPDCITFLTKGDTNSIKEPMDREMAGQGTTIKNVTIEYNPTVAPGYRSVKMLKNGKPFCKTKVD